MTGKKKLLIGAGIVVILGAIAFANFKFKRVEGVTVNAEAIKSRDLEALVSASGKIQPKRFVNISADTMGRVTTWPSRKATASRRGSSSCRSTRGTSAPRSSAPRPRCRPRAPRPTS